MPPQGSLAASEGMGGICIIPGIGGIPGIMPPPPSVVTMELELEEEEEYVMVDLVVPSGLSVAAAMTWLAAWLFSLTLVRPSSVV